MPGMWEGANREQLFLLFTGSCLLLRAECQMTQTPQADGQATGWGEGLSVGLEPSETWPETCTRWSAISRTSL